MLHKTQTVLPWYVLCRQPPILKRDSKHGNAKFSCGGLLDVTAMTKADKRTQRGREDNTTAATKYAAKRQSHPVIRTDAAAAIAHQKQATKGLQQFRARQEVKRLHTAKQLRSYQRACKREGYEPGSGASRKRQNASSPTTTTSTTTTTTTTDTAVVVAKSSAPTTATTGSTESAEPSHDANKNGIDSRAMNDEEKISTSSAVSLAEGKPEPHMKQSAKKKPHHMANKLDKRQLERQQQVQERERLLQQRDQQRQEALQRRRQRHKLLTARTAKGQPVMKNLVQDILNQLQQQQKQQANETKRSALP
jgi:rRNA processing